MLSNSFRSSESLVSIHNQQPITTSLLVADKFGKRHGDILRSIGKINSANAKVRSLYQSAHYKDDQDKNRPMYLMNKDGFVLLVMGFTGPQALAFKIDYINAFNAMEAKLRRMLPLEKLKIHQCSFDKSKNISTFAFDCYIQKSWAKINGIFLNRIKDNAR